jgi:hypothetical protein
MTRFTSRTGAPAVGLALLALFASGCGKDRSRDEGPVSVPIPARTASASGPTMRVVVSELATDPTIDPQGVRAVFRDAETSLLECLDVGETKGASGIVAISFPLEHDGAVGTLVEGSKTTLKDERARLCIERAVAEMRFSSTAGSRAEIAVSLEVRPRRAVE